MWFLRYFRKHWENISLRPRYVKNTPLTLFPPTGWNQSIYEYHVTTASRNRVKIQSCLRYQTLIYIFTENRQYIWNKGQKTRGLSGGRWTCIKSAGNMQCGLAERSLQQSLNSQLYRRQQGWQLATTAGTVNMLWERVQSLHQGFFLGSLKPKTYGASNLVLFSVKDPIGSQKTKTGCQTCGQRPNFFVADFSALADYEKFNLGHSLGQVTP